MIEKKKLTPIVLAGIFVLMLGLSYAAVPLYDLFCRVTGFGGTTQTHSSFVPQEEICTQMIYIQSYTPIKNEHYLL